MPRPTRMAVRRRPPPPNHAPGKQPAKGLRRPVTKQPARVVVKRNAKQQLQPSTPWANKRTRGAGRKRSGRSASPLTAMALFTGNVRQALGLSAQDAAQPAAGKAKPKATRVKAPVFNVAMDDEIFIMMGQQPFLGCVHKPTRLRNVANSGALSRLFLGNYGAVLDNELLAHNEISVIFNAIKGWKYRKNHQRVVEFPLNDTQSQQVSGAFLHRAADAIHSFLSSGERVMVHCVYGMNRSSTLVAAYLIKYHAFTVQRAKLLLSDVRGVEVLTNDSFRFQLQRFQKTARLAPPAAAVPTVAQ